MDRISRAERQRGGVHYALQPVQSEIRIEVRGQTLDEAMPAVEQFLDRAYRAGLPPRGSRARQRYGDATTSRPRTAAHAPVGDKFEGAPREEGGEGVTLVYMAV